MIGIDARRLARIISRSIARLFTRIKRAIWPYGAVQTIQVPSLRGRKSRAAIAEVER